jgi:hypothetical protein
VTAVALHQVPGFTPAMSAIRHLGGLLLPEDVAQRFAMVALAAAVPHMRAELLADLADELADDFPEVATVLDNASHQLRKALTP